MTTSRERRQRLKIYVFLIAFLFGTVGLFFHYFEKLQNNPRYFEGKVNAKPYSFGKWLPSLSFHLPVSVLPNGENRNSAFVIERQGKVLKVDGINTIPTSRIVLDIFDKVYVSVNGGVSGAIIHPKDKSLFIAYTFKNKKNELQGRISRFAWDSITETFKKDSESILLEQSSGIHLGGGFVFDKDGYLLVGIGDMGDSAKSAKPNEYLAGGILRLDVDQPPRTSSTLPVRIAKDTKRGQYRIPHDNPWVGSNAKNNDRPLEEYYAMGMRNPFRLFLDPVDHKLWAVDVGSDFFEEINIIEKGGHYGAPHREGEKIIQNSTLKSTEPIFSFAHKQGFKCIIGGMVYHGAKFPEFQNSYFYTGCMNPNLYRIFKMGDRILNSRVDAQIMSVRLNESPAQILQFHDDILMVITGVPGILKPENTRIRVLQHGSREKNEAVEKSDPYQLHCAPCHGSKGIPEDVFANQVVPRTFRSAEWQAKVTDAEIEKVIRKGGQGTGRSSAMPAWENSLTDEEINNLVTKIRSFGPVKN